MTLVQPGEKSGQAIERPVRIASPTAPTGVTENGSTVAAAASLVGFQAATGGSWFYDGQTVYVKAPAATGTRWNGFTMWVSTFMRRARASAMPGMRAPPPLK